MSSDSGEATTQREQERQRARRVYLIDRDFQLREVNRGVIMFMSAAGKRSRVYLYKAAP